MVKSADNPSRRQSQFQGQALRDDKNLSQSSRSEDEGGSQHHSDVSLEEEPPHEDHAIVVYKPSESKSVFKEAFKLKPTTAVDSLEKDVAARKPV